MNIPELLYPAEMLANKCSGFYREIIEVSTFEIFAVAVIYLTFTGVLWYIFTELIIRKKDSRLMLLCTMIVLSVFVVKLFLPLSEYYVEVPFYSQFDCTFNFLIYPEGFSPNIDLLFVYARLLSLVALPFLLFIVCLKLVILVARKIRYVLAK